MRPATKEEGFGRITSVKASFGIANESETEVYSEEDHGIQQNENYSGAIDRSGILS